MSAKKATKANMQVICDGLAQGKSLRSVCASDSKLPHWVNVLKAVQRDENFYEMYSRARAIGAEVLSDEMHDLAASPLPEGLDPKLAMAEIQRRRIEVDTKKWTFSKMQPRGVRHKKQDIEQQGGEVTLVWGEQKKEQAEIVKLVQKKKEVS
tara:strand:- start:1315 stop:1770 length:456 start_codon:yes stop_codon:yes gene_type:complete